MTADGRTVYLFDIDNTLIDHDGLKHRVTAWIEREVGVAGSAAFWSTYEDVRRELGIVDFMEAARRFEGSFGGQCADGLVRFLWEFPFEELLLGGTREGWERLRPCGKLAVLCDGERGFQERKLERIGLLPLLEQVFVFDHKENHLAEVDARFPGADFVMFDDKPRVLRAARQHFGPRLQPVHVRHGHYADEVFEGETIDSIGAFSPR